MTTGEALKSFKSDVRKVRLAQLRSDKTYQRELSMTMVDKIVRDWSVFASELLLVSNRGERAEGDEIGGGLWIINGQHRTAAAQKRGEQYLDARVIDLSEEPDPVTIEAGLRLKTNVRLGDRPLERFKAQLAAKDEGSLHIVEILARFDTEINPIPLMDAGVNAVSSIEQIYRIDGGSLLTDTLEMISDSFGRVGGKSASANMLKAVAWFIERHASEADRDRVVRQIRSIGLAALEQRARVDQATMGGMLWLNYYRQIIALYNDKLSEKNKLEVRTRGSRGALGRKGQGDEGSWGGV